jgi:acyl-CoA reductase-like NAD-dependent aldehyde dehydrogenase
MAIELSVPQLQALDAQRGEMLRIVDPRNRLEYVMVPAAVFECVKEMVEEAEDKALEEAWLKTSTETRCKWVEENPY